MKRTIIAAVTLLIASAAYSQQALVPGTGLVSPEINPDNSVTFRYYNPKAITVQVTGDFLPSQVQTITAEGRQRRMDVPGVADLKEENGIWTYTTEPLEGELYSYSLIVDGFKTMDPSNIYQNRDIATWTNIFTLSTEKGDKGWYYEVQDVPHGLWQPSRLQG